MPRLISMYIRHVAIGFAVAAAFVALILWFNVMNLWGLVINSRDGLLAVFMLWFMNGIVFAGVQFAFAVMQMANKDDRSSGKGGKMMPIAAPARAPAAQGLRISKANWLE